MSIRILGSTFRSRKHFEDWVFHLYMRRNKERRTDPNRPLSEAEIAKQDAVVVGNRKDPRKFCCACAGSGCDQCMNTGFPERFFRAWERNMGSASRADMARAAQVWHEWAVDGGGTADEMSEQMMVPKHMIEEDEPYNLLQDWVSEHHGLGFGSSRERYSDDQVMEGCAVMASIYLSEANR